MSRKGLAFAAILAGVLLACAGDEGEPTRPAPTRIRAALVLEPPQVGLGDVAVVEVAVVTPPDHRVRPFRPPESVPGFWLLDAEADEVEKQDRRWVHRTRLRVRAREVGRFQWPESAIEVEGPDGSLSSLDLESFPLEVLSVMPEFPEQEAPFGALSRAAPVPAGRGMLAGAAVGSLVSLALVGLVGVARRRRAARGTRDRDAADDEAELAPWVEARACLRAARQVGTADPLRAAHATAGGLRRYVARRFGADAEARTTPELESAPPPFAATSRWPQLLSILRTLDALRFPIPDAGLSEQVSACIDAAERFVEESVPPESRS